MPKLSERVPALRQERPLKLLTIIYCHDVQLQDLFFLFTLSPTKNTSKERGNLDQDLILGKLHFPKELIPFIIISTIVFNKIHHQKSLSDLWDAETHSKLWMRGHITWQRGRGHKYTSVRRRHKASGDVRGVTCKQWHQGPMCRADTTGTVACDTLIQCLKQRSTLASSYQNCTNTTKQKNVTVWKGYSWTRIIGTAAFLHVQNFKITRIFQYVHDIRSVIEAKYKVSLWLQYQVGKAGKESQECFVHLLDQDFLTTSLYAPITNPCIQ